jgi:hypothetical protein
MNPFGTVGEPQELDVLGWQLCAQLLLAIGNLVARGGRYPIQQQ